MAKVITVGILGGTGTVGQKFIQLLDGHPFFRVTCIGASERSIGKHYSEVTPWKLPTSIPDAIVKIVITACQPQEFQGKCSVIFSALDASVAGPIEEDFAKAGFAVFSNAKNHRMDSDVPILIPAVNHDHIHSITHQRKQRGYDAGYIVTNANCSSTGLVVALKPILDKFGIEQCIVFTMQAISGAGYPGVSALDIVDNVVPFISGEEEKMAIEPQKILGTWKDNQFRFLDSKFAAHCNRVMVLDGHTECVSIKLRKPADISQIEQALREFVPLGYADLPSAPSKAVVVMSEKDRPQPRMDRNIGQGYSVVVGRIRPCEIFDVKMTILSHNTVLGAAGGSILNAELAYKEGYM